MPSFPNGTYPDLIIYRRGKNSEKLLIMEFKTYWNSNQKDDIREIKEFMNIQGEYKYEYKYEYGISVLVNRNKSAWKWI